MTSLLGICLAAAFYQGLIARELSVVFFGLWLALLGVIAVSHAAFGLGAALADWRPSGSRFWTPWAGAAVLLSLAVLLTLRPGAAEIGPVALATAAVLSASILFGAAYAATFAAAAARGGFHLAAAVSFIGSAAGRTLWRCLPPKNPLKWKTVIKHLAAALLVLAILTLDGGAENAPRYNLVIIAVDGLRADHLPIYGYARQTAPLLSQRAKKGVVFERAVSQASWTLPSFAAFFTSRYPQDHGANSNRLPLADDAVMLTQVLHDAGYRTAGFVGGHFLDPVWGFGRGFDVYRGAGQGVFRFFRETAAQAAVWIRENKDKRFFLFIHGNDVHPPFDLTRQGEKMVHAFDQGYSGPVDSLLIDYLFISVFNKLSFQDVGPTPPDSYLRGVESVRNPQDIAHIAAHYDAQIKDVDATLERVFTAIRDAGREKDTVVVLMSDHGLEWGEKGMLSTAYHVTQYDTVTKVPLVIWHPELKARRVAPPVQLVDLAPTLLELLGVAAPQAFRGASFAGLARASADLSAPRFAFSTSSLLRDPEGRIRMNSVQDGRWKLIVDAEMSLSRLFDLKADPSENADAAAAHPDVVRRLTATLVEHLSRLPLQALPKP